MSPFSSLSPFSSSEGATPALFGTFTYNATSVVPEPTSAALVGMGGLLLTRRRDRRSAGWRSA